ncbi:MAG: single-stranded-DNA-specific exonuclease RecJ, partial [Selenomonadaceae bacterium]|nr:single-stranded-DNA-specific exonuclease RecJ [Selenomonadaceae bacterium]
MKDMDKAVERILSAIRKEEQIVVYGDYDVDGITATTILVRTLRHLGAKADYYIPDRQKEGYGFNLSSLH